MEDVIETQEAPEIVEAPITEQAVTTENAEPSEGTVETKPEKTFTQAELNDIITKRLERERESITKKVAQEARDAYFAEQGYIHPITKQTIRTEAEYNQALKDQETFDAYQKEGYPDEAIQKILAVEKSQEEIKAKLSEYESKSKTEKDFKIFLDAFPDAKPDEIPATVWAEVDKGTSLVDAYTRHENKVLKEKLAQVEQQKQIEQLNQANAESSTGSVTGNGSNVPTFFTAKQVEAMSKSDVNKHWDAINASMKNPKFYD